MFPHTDNAVVVRTDFDNPQAWETVCELIRSPVQHAGETFYAYVDFVDDTEYQNLSTAEVIAAVPRHYKHSFLFIVDRNTLSSDDFPIVVADLSESRHQTFRAVPGQIQNIENNLSIANMDFEEFAEAVDEDETFHGFPTA